MRIRIGMLIAGVVLAALGIGFGMAPAGAAGPTPGPSPAPAPHIVGTFAGAVSGQRHALPRARVASVPVRRDVDGCDRSYGEATQCVPTKLPPGQSNLCAWLASHGLRAVKVHGPDTQRVDTDRNGIACG